MERWWTVARSGIECRSGQIQATMGIVQILSIVNRIISPSAKCVNRVGVGTCGSWKAVGGEVKGAGVMRSDTFADTLAGPQVVGIESLQSCGHRNRSSTLALLTTPGSPAPGWVPAPTK